MFVSKNITKWRTDYYPYKDLDWNVYPYKKITFKQRRLLGVYFQNPNSKHNGVFGQQLAAATTAIANRGLQAKSVVPNATTTMLFRCYSALVTT